MNSVRNAIPPKLTSIANPFLTHHTSIHTPQTPHIQTIIILLEIDQQLRALEVSRSHPNVVFRSRVIEFGETPIDQSELFLLVINHDVVGFDISMHDTLGMAEVESLLRD